MKTFYLFFLFGLLAHSFDIKEQRASEWVKNGFWFYQEGDFKSAMTCYKKALELKPDFADAWYWYGNSLFRYGMGDIAKVCYERCLRLSDYPHIKNKLERYWGEKKDGYTHIFTIKGDVADTSRFFSPASIYIDRLDNLYIAGFGNDVILKLSLFGEEILRIKDKALKKPFGVCVDEDGNIYATSYSNNCVLKFSPQGKQVLRFGKRGIKNGCFIGPKAIEVDSSGYIYVVDATRMQKFSNNGKFIGKIDNLLSPNSICLDNGYIFISESSSVKKFTSSFNYISSIKIKPKWVKIYNNNLYITTNEGIFIYSKELKPITKIKTDFILYSLAFNRCGFLYATSPDQSEIHTFYNPSNSLDLIVNRIDLVNYPLILFSITLKADRYDVKGLSDKNFRVLEENKAAYPLGVGEVRKENLGIAFVIEDSKYIKEKEVRKILSSFLKQFKDGFGGSSIISFSSGLRVLSNFTLNKTQIKDAISSLSFKGDVSESAFLSSLNKGITSAIPLLSKKAVIVFTSVKFKKETDEIKRLGNYARNNGIPIFIIDYKKDKDVILEKLSSLTDGKYFLARNSKEINNFYNFLDKNLSNQTQYILYYRSPNASLKWSNEWTSVDLEIGQGRFGYYEKLSYLIPPSGGASSSLGRTLIEKELYLEELQKIKEIEKEKKKKRKEIKEALKAEEGKKKGHGEKKEEKKEEKEEEEVKEEKEEGKKHGGH